MCLILDNQEDDDGYNGDEYDYDDSESNSNEKRWRKWEQPET